MEKLFVIMSRYIYMLSILYHLIFKLSYLLCISEFYNSYFFHNKDRDVVILRSLEIAS